MQEEIRTRILLVDDDPIVVRNVAAGLTKAGYAVESCSDANTALRTYRRAPPDVALLDIGLPDMCGTELAMRMLETRYRPLLILSGYSDTDRVRQAIDSGVVGYMVKPIHTHQLIPNIETALARFGTLNQCIASRFGQQVSGAIHLQSVIDRLSFGVLILDDKHSILAQNHAAERLLGRGDLLCNRGGRLCAVQPADSAPFRDLVNVGLGRAPGHADGSVLSMCHHTTARLLHLWTAPLAGPPGEETSPPCPATTILVVVDPDQFTVAPAPLLHTLYGLTEKESRLAEALLNGKTIEEYCRCTHVSLNTAKTHLKAVYRKTNTNRQVDLVRLLSHLFLNIEPPAGG